MLLRLLMEAVLSLENTPLLFLMAVPNTSSTPLTITTVMLPRLPTKELLCTQRRNLMHLHMHLPPHIMLKPSLCFVNIYQIFMLNITTSV